MPRDILHPTPHRSRFAAFWHSFGHDLAVSAAACGVIALLLLGTAPPSFAQGFIRLIVPVYEEVAVEESLVDEEIKRVAVSNSGDEPVAIARVTKTQAGVRASKGSGSHASGGGTKSSESKSSGSGSVSGSGGGSASPSQSISQSGGTATVRSGSAPSAPNSGSQTANASAPSPPATAPAPAPTPAPAPAPDGGGEGDHCTDGHGNDGNNKGCQ